MAKTTEPTTEIRAAVDKLAADFSNYATTPVESGGNTNRNASGRHTNEPPTIEHFLAFHHSRKHQGALTAGLVVFAILIVGTWMILMQQKVTSMTFINSTEASIIDTSQSEFTSLIEQYSETTAQRAKLQEQAAARANLESERQKNELRSVLGAALTASSTTEQPN